MTKPTSYNEIFHSLIEAIILCKSQPMPMGLSSTGRVTSRALIRRIILESDISDNEFIIENFLDDIIDWKINNNSDIISDVIKKINNLDISEKDKKALNAINYVRENFSSGELLEETGAHRALETIFGLPNESLNDPVECEKLLQSLQTVLSVQNLKTGWAQRVTAQRDIPNSLSSLPTKAPALWKEDKKPGDTPVAFIQRHYKPWLGKELTRKDIKNLDEPLYRGLYSWLRSNELPEGFELPTAKEVNDAQVNDFRDGNVPQDEAERQRLRAASRRRM